MIKRRKLARKANQVLPRIVRIVTIIMTIAVCISIAVYDQIQAIILLIITTKRNATVAAVHVHEVLANVVMHGQSVSVHGWRRFLQIAYIIHTVCVDHRREMLLLQMWVMQEEVVVQVMHAHVVQVSLADQVLVDVCIL
jgi:hypothetical protein